MTKEKELQVEEQAQTQADQPLPEENRGPTEVMQIVVIGKEGSKNTRLLANLIKESLENNYYFRTQFEGIAVQLRELIEPIQVDPKPNT